VRITLLAAGFVIGKSCQLCAALLLLQSHLAMQKSPLCLACLQHKSASTMCCLRL
jgi:hypothetical protein